MSLPWIPGAVHVVLMADSAFNAACGGRLSTRLPKNVALAVATMQVSGGIPIDGGGVAFSPLIQVTGWCPPGGAGDLDAEIQAWNIAAEAARVLGRIRNVTYQSMRYSARLTDGPIADYDTSRGEAAPLYRAFIRAELSVHTE